MIKEGNQSLEDFKKDLQSKGPDALDAIYLLYKDEFVNFCRKFNISEDKILDIYQDSMIAFYENVVSGKLSEMSSTIKTYIFSIGKYSIYNMLKKENKTVSFDRQHLENLDLSIVSSSQESENKIEIVQEALQNIGDKCKQILVLFYYHSYTIEALMLEMGYKNENVVRAHKSRCIRTLKEMIRNGID